MERRHATRPYYRQSAARDYVLASVSTFLIGAFCGAAVILAVAS